MSLINEALKKAQRLRNEEPEATASPAPAATGGVRIAKRSKAHSANTMVLIGSGAIVLIVLSTVITVYLVNRPSTSPVAAAPTGVVSPPPATTEPAAPVTVASGLTSVTSPPNSEPTATTSSAAGNPTPATANVEPATAPAPLPATTAPAVAQTPAPVTPPPPPGPDERVSSFVEAIRVAGIRSSGTESRVLMNDRVYRVNDIVDRGLNIRLIKVASDTLTFSDPNGVTYVKQF